MCGNCYRKWQRDHATPNATCEVCGRDYFRRSGSRPNGRTCGRECYAKWKVGRDCFNRATDGAEFVERECEHCHEAFRVERRQVKKGLGRFCSIQCSAGRREVPRLVGTCVWCGQRFEHTPGRVFHAGLRYCSRNCFRVAAKAEKLPREGERGRAYRRFRDRVVAGDACCADCGSTVDLALHHRIRTRERPDLLLAKDNLVILCRRCHARHHNAAGHTHPGIAA